MSEDALREALCIAGQAGKLFIGVSRLRQQCVCWQFQQRSLPSYRLSQPTAKATAVLLSVLSDVILPTRSGLVHRRTRLCAVQIIDLLTYRYLFSIAVQCMILSLIHI